MASSDKTHTIEDYGTRPVPPGLGRTGLQLGIVILGVATCIPTFMMGGILAAHATLLHAFVAVLLGAVVLTAISCATGILGAHTRLSTAMSARFVFGHSGSAVIAILLFVGSFGWFGIQLEVFGKATAHALALLSDGNVTVSRWLPILLGGPLMTLTAALGFNAIEKLTRLVIPFLLLLLGATLVTAFRGADFAALIRQQPSDPLSLGVLVSMVAGGYAIGATLQPDLTRYSKSASAAVSGTLIGMLAGFPLVLAASVALAAVSGQSDFTEVMLQFHSGLWGALAMMVIVFATWTTNDNNLYSAALAFNVLTPRTPKWVLSALGGALGTGLALAGALEQYTHIMLVLGIAIPPVGAVMAVDFFLARRREGYCFAEIASLPAVRFAPFFAWVCGAVFGFATYGGHITLTSAPALDAALVAAVLHAGLLRIPRASAPPSQTARLREVLRAENRILSIFRETGPQSVISDHGFEGSEDRW